MINISEILVANCTGIMVLWILAVLRVECRGSRCLEDKLFRAMEIITLEALAVETVSFLLDGYPGRAVTVLQLLCNSFLFVASCGVGLIWLMYADCQIYRSRKRLKRMLRLFCGPFLLVAVLAFCDLFGAGFIYSITEENVYLRGRLVAVPYVVLYFYYFTSFVLALWAVERDDQVQFFPIYYFVIPCVAGTVVQGIFYGLATGWFSVSLALMFIQIQLKNQSAFVDDLSGLYNRKYYLYFIGRLRNSRKCKTVSGIMLDVNHFKSINDQFGHTMGDDAIRNVGLILSQVTADREIAFRLAGDEFIVISQGASEEETRQLMGSIEKKLEQFNTSSGKPYQLYLAMGYALCDTAGLDSDKFLHRMDTKMYEAKAAYYSRQERDRRRNRTPEQPQ